MGTLNSSTETPTSTSRTKIIGTCKVISLGSGKEYEVPSQQDTDQQMKNLTSSNVSEEPSTSTTIPLVKER